MKPFVLKIKVPMGFCSLNEIVQESKYKNVQQPGTVARCWPLSSLLSQPAISPCRKREAYRPGDRELRYKDVLADTLLWGLCCSSSLS